MIESNPAANLKEKIETGARTGSLRDWDLIGF